MIYIGIDTGTHTGIAVWAHEKDKFLSIETKPIHEAMDIVKSLIDDYGKDNVHIRFEDARQRKWFGNAGREQLQGAGSIKRDCQIWEDFLKGLKVKFMAVPPKNNKTKLSAKQFEFYTGWNKRTSEHARDAAMLVYGL